MEVRYKIILVPIPSQAAWPYIRDNLNKKENCTTKGCYSGTELQWDEFRDTDRIGPHQRNFSALLQIFCHKKQEI